MVTGISINLDPSVARGVASAGMSDGGPVAFGAYDLGRMSTLKSR